MSKVNNRTALDEIMLSIEKRKTLKTQVKRLANDTTALKIKQDILKDDIKAVSEALGITSTKLNELIKVYNGNLEDIIDEMTSTINILQTIKESDNG